MRYFVVTADGRFGPVDMDALNSWATDGRITAFTVLEEESSGARIEASSLPGLSFRSLQDPPPAPGVASSEPPPPKVVSNYRRPNYEPPLFLESEIDGRKEVLYSFIFAVVGPLIAFVHIYGIGMVAGGIYCGALAIKRGRKLGALGILANIIAMAFAVFLYFAGFWRY
jgi:hypothetical protein